jgi:putative phage-type endonuclease
MKKHIQKIPTGKMSREDWLIERRKSLGGSDMGAVLGLNPWRSPYAVWAEKTGRVTDDRETEAMRIGRDLEPYVAQRFSEASGKTVRRLNALLRNNRMCPWLHANVDRLIVGEESGLECKTASALNASKFTGGEFPATYYAQCVTYLAVTEYERWYLAVLVMGREFKVFQMTRIPDDPCPEWCESSVYVSPEEIEALITAAAEFWDRVKFNDPPPVDGLPATADALAQVIGRSNDEKYIDLTGIQATVRAYLKLRDEDAERKELLTKYENQIKEYMGDAAGASCELAKFSWKSQSSKRFDLKRFKKEHPEVDITGYYNYSTSRPFKVTVN